MVVDGLVISLMVVFSDDIVCIFINEDVGLVFVGCFVDLCVWVVFDIGGGLVGFSIFGGGLFISNNFSGVVNIIFVFIDFSIVVFLNMVFDLVGIVGDVMV